jgi:hypothetical protein
MSEKHPREARSEDKKTRVWFIPVMLTGIRHSLSGGMSAFWSKIPSGTKGHEELSTSALIEALRPKK